jgi:hypothetical protein
MDFQAELSALDQISRYRTAKVLLKRDATVSIIFGALALLVGAAGVRVNIINLLLAAIGAFVIAAGVSARRSPGPGTLIACAAGLLVIGMWNLFVPIYNLVHAAERDPHGMGGLIIGCFQVFWGVKMMQGKSRHAAISLASPPEAVKALDELADAVRKSKEKNGDEFVSVDCSGFTSPLVLKGKLMPEGAFFVDTGGVRTFLVRRDDVELSLKGDVKKSNKGTLRVGAEKFPCRISKTSCERILAWKGPEAPQAPNA